MPRWEGSWQDRFNAKIWKTLYGCWEWRGCKSIDGYGRYGKKLAHRVAWEKERGQVSAGLEIDHRCRNRACVNPDHMEAVDHKTNIDRGIGERMLAHRRGECLAGHAMSDNNISGHQCRICLNVNAKKRYHENREDRRAKARERYARRFRD